MREPQIITAEKWGLSQEAFDALLSRLDTDVEKAGVRYELLRWKLVRLFEWRGAVEPECLADETFNRIARRIIEGEEIQNIGSYSAAVARLVWLEASRKQDRLRPLDATAGMASTQGMDDVDAERHTCLDMCLDRLTAEERKLILDYYDGTKGDKVRQRREMAARLGIEINAVRIRVCRIRARLELCVKDCVSRRGAR